MTVTAHFVTNEDVEYFRQRLERAIARRNGFEEKERRQLEAIEDAVIIYHEQRSPENE